MKEELRNEQCHYENFIQQGHAILDKTDPDSSDAGVVSQRLDDVNAAWDRLATQLGERESSLGDVLDASTQFHDTVNTLQQWLPLAADAADTLTTQSPAEQRQQLKVLYDTIQYDTRCYFNVHSKADMRALVDLQSAVCHYKSLFTEER